MKNRKARKREQAQYREEKRVEAVRSRIPLTMVGAKPEKCGECQACCMVLGVHDTPEGGKPCYTKCVHQIDTGCGIYSTRPQSCRNYWCMYLSGFLTGGEEMRPDKLGVIIEQKVDDGGIPVLVLWETRPDAMQEPRVLKLIQDLKLKTKFALRYQTYGFNLNADGVDPDGNGTENVHPRPIIRPLLGVNQVS